VKALRIMNPLKALFGTEERFLSLIEASAEEVWVGNPHAARVRSPPDR
jgi:hypothetical protein